MTWRNVAGSQVYCENTEMYQVHQKKPINKILKTTTKPEKILQQLSDLNLSFKTPQSKSKPKKIDLNILK